MDYQQLRSAIGSAVPLNTHLGIEVVEIGDGYAVARLPEEGHLKNHIGTQHAAALFAVAEAASGAAMLGAFADHSTEIVPLARDATITYRRLAIGPITAAAAINGETASLVAAFESTGRAQFTVDVSLSDGHDKRVASVAVTWNVRRAGASS